MKLEKTIRRKPAVPTELPRCQAVVPARSGWRNEAEHQCPFAATISGFCMRHDPENMRESWQKQLERHRRKVAELEEKLAALPIKPLTT
jgi:hypothetical protein